MAGGDLVHLLDEGVEDDEPHSDGLRAGGREEELVHLPGYLRERRDLQPPELDEPAAAAPQRRTEAETLPAVVLGSGQRTCTMVSRLCLSICVPLVAIVPEGVTLYRGRTQLANRGRKMTSNVKRKEENLKYPLPSRG